MDWWSEAVFGPNNAVDRGTMPPEMLQILVQQGLHSGSSAEALAEARSKANSRKRLPAELVDMIRKEGLMPEALMTVEEANRLRLELMDVRSRFIQKSESAWEQQDYSFCEH